MWLVGLVVYSLNGYFNSNFPYEKQIKFFFRLLYHSPEKWSHQALLDHMSGAWKSPYMTYIYSIRSELGIFAASFVQSVWMPLSANFFLEKCNTALSSYSCLMPLSQFSRAKYVCENDLSSVITQFKFDNANLGNKSPRVGYPRKVYCPLCPVPHKISCFHVLFVCSSISGIRTTTCIQSFINTSVVMNIDLEKAYFIFVNGLDYSEKSVSMEVYFERAKCMEDMRLAWLSKW